MEFKLIRLSEIEPAKRDPRLTEEKPGDPAFRELVDSVRAFGVVEPIVVRQHPANEDRFQICAGSRRVAACKFLKKDTIPALVYGALDDTDAFGITFAENKGRRPLSVMEEALAVDQLLEVHGGDIPAVASLLGKTPREIRMLENIQRLIPAWRSPKNPLLQLLTLAHLALVARLPDEIQKRLLDDTDIFYKNEWDGNGACSVAELEKALAAENHRLASAPWDPALCGKCPKRSDAERQRGLFEDERLAEKSAALSALCLDANCWEEKATAFAAQKFEAVKKDAPDAVFEGARGFYSWNYKGAKKGEKGAIPLVSKKGAVSYVKPSDSARQAEKEKKAARPDPAKALEFKRQKYAIQLIREKLLKIAQARPRKECTFSMAELLRAIYVCGVEGPESLKRALAQDKQPEIEKELFERIACSAIGALNTNYYGMTSVPADTWGLARFAAETLLQEKLGLFEAAAEEKFPGKKGKAARK